MAYMDLMTEEDYKNLINSPNAKNYQGRWEYFKEVISIINTENPMKTIELGPGYLPIVKNGDIILNPLDDSFGKPQEFQGHIHIFDATLKPWAIEDKSYDMFIALQVWEHLDGKQTRAFREVMRIAKKAILGFPYNWDGSMIDNPSPYCKTHRDIDMELIRDWTLGIEPELSIEIGRTGPEFSKGPCMICFWDFTKSNK